MLDFMRRNAQSWGIKAALGTIVLVFIFFMGGGGRIGAAHQPLVKVGTIDITRPEYDLAQRRNENYFRQQFKGQMSDAMMKQLNVAKMTLDQLIDGAVLRSEADRLGLTITEDAIREQLMRVPSFQSNGQFSPTLYRETLRAQSMTPGAFEETVRQDLLESQLADIIRRGSHVSEEEAWGNYQRENRRMALSYIAFDSADYQKDVTVDDEKLAKFFEAKQETFRQPPSVKIRYIPYKVDAVAEKIEVSDVDLNEYYDLNKNSEFQKEEQIAARHILKKVAKDATEDQKKVARAAIEAVQKKLADGGNFEEIAKAESEDPGSAAKGGDLGYFPRGRMVPAFDNAAFALEAGKTSDIVESDFGFHIIQVYDKKPAGISSFEEVKDSVKKTLANQKAIDRVFEDSAEDSAKLASGTKLEDIASARGVSIEETPAFPEGDMVPGVGASPSFSEAAFNLANPGDVSQPVKSGNDYYILALVERKESRIPSLEEVRSEVETAYKEQESIDLARKKADELLEKAKAGATLEQIAEENHLEVKTADNVGGGQGFVQGVGPVQGLAEVAFAAAKDGDPLGRSFVSGKKAYIFVRNSVTDATRDAFNDVKDEQIKQLEQAREQAALKDFIESRKRQLQANEEISYDLAQLRPLLGDNTPAVE